MSKGGLTKTEKIEEKLMNERVMGFNDLKKHKWLLIISALIAGLIEALIIYANPAILANPSIVEFAKTLHYYNGLAFNSEWKDILIMNISRIVSIGIAAIFIFAMAWLVNKLKHIEPSIIARGLLVLAMLSYFSYTTNKLTFFKFEFAILIAILIVTIGHLFKAESIKQLIKFAIDWLVGIPLSAIFVLAITITFTETLKSEGLPLIANWIFFVCFAVIIIKELLKSASKGVKGLRNFRSFYGNSVK